MKEVKEYKLKKDVSAPLANARRTGLTQPKIFKKDDVIKGYVLSSAVDGKAVIIAEDKYALFSDNLEEVKTFNAEGEQASSSTVVNKKDLPTELQKQLDALKDTSVVSRIVKKSKNSVNGMLIGAGIGFIFGIYFKKGIFLPTVIGATLGGFVGHTIVPKEKKPVPDELKPKLQPTASQDSPKITMGTAITQTSKS